MTAPLRELAADVRQRLVEVDWAERRCVLEREPWTVYLDECLDWMTAFIIQSTDGESGWVITSPTTWQTLYWDPKAYDLFLDGVEEAGPGMYFIPADDGHFANAVRKQAEVLIDRMQVDALFDRLLD